MPRINHPAIHWPLLLASLMLCVCGFAQIQRPTPDNPYPMPPMTVDNGPPATSTPTPEPVPEPAPKPAYRPAYQPPAPPVTPKPAAPAAKPSPSVPANRPAAAPPRPVPYSILNTPAEPARVTLASGKLTIEATNSSLSSILRQIAKAGGMKIAGPYPNSGQRIFGKYGPGAPREVLSDLLTGSGYNIMMLGITPAGTPRELSLSARAAGGVPRPSSQSAQPNQDVDNYDDSVPPEQMEDQGTQEEQGQPQEEAQPPEEPQTPPSAQNRVRTPEQILQELQRMHQQQEQQPPQ